MVQNLSFELDALIDKYKHFFLQIAGYAEPFTRYELKKLP